MTTHLGHAPDTRGAPEAHPRRTRPTRTLSNVTPLKCLGRLLSKFDVRIVFACSTHAKKPAVSKTRRRQC